MTNIPAAPPLFRLVALAADADVPAEASSAAAQGADPATLLWADRTDRAVCAIVLAPEQPLSFAAQMAYVGMVSLGDALGAVLPALMVITHRLPNEIRLNEAHLGSLRLIAPKGVRSKDVPDWLVLAADVAVTRFADGSAKASDLSQTTLEDEGCMDIMPGEINGAFARYLLTWINRWQSDGFRPIKTSWMTRAGGVGAEMTLTVEAQARSGLFRGIGDAGEILITGNGDDEAIEVTNLAER